MTLQISEKGKLRIKYAIAFGGIIEYRESRRKKS